MRQEKYARVGRKVIKLSRLSVVENPKKSTELLLELKTKFSEFAG